MHVNSSNSSGSSTCNSSGSNSSEIPHYQTYSPVIIKNYTHSHSDWIQMCTATCLLSGVIFSNLFPILCSIRFNFILFLSICVFFDNLYFQLDFVLPTMSEYFSDIVQFVLNEFVDGLRIQFPLFTSK
eukprot:127544_1